MAQHSRPNYWWLLPVGLVILAVALAVVAVNTTGHHHAAAKPTSVSSPAPSISEPDPEDSAVAPSSSSSASPLPSSNPSITVSPTPTTPLINLSTMPEGVIGHTVVKPFGVVTVYKIKPGDTLFDIANTFRVAGADLTLYQWNASVVGKNPALIHPGTVIIVDPKGKISTQ